MITQIDIKELRTLKNVSIPFKPLTLLTGEHGTGKTTILTILDCQRSFLIHNHSIADSIVYQYFDDYGDYDPSPGIKIHTNQGTIDWDSISRHNSKIIIKPIMFDFTHWTPHDSDEYSRGTNTFLGYNFDSPTFVTFSLYTAFNAVESLLTAKAGDIILLENPEAVLHPRLQTKIGKLIGETVLRGVQVIVETHSDHLIDGIRILICQGKLNPDDVQVNFLTNGEVKTPTLLASGKVKNCPDGFLSQCAVNLKELLNLDK